MHATLCKHTNGCVLTAIQDGDGVAKSLVRRHVCLVLKNEDVAVRRFIEIVQPCPCLGFTTAPEALNIYICIHIYFFFFFFKYIYGDRERERHLMNIEQVWWVPAECIPLGVPRVIAE